MRTLALAACVLLAVGLAGCATNGQPNSLGLSAEPGTPGSTLRLIGVMADFVGAASGVQAARYRPIDRFGSSAIDAPYYRPSTSSDALEHVYPTPTGGYGRVHHMSSPLTHVKVRTRNGGFRRSYPGPSANCEPQPACLLR